MPAIQFSKSVLKQRTKLTAGWRKLKVASVDYTPGKKDPTAHVYKIKVVVSEGPDKDVPITFWLSEKTEERIADYVSLFVDGELDPTKKYAPEDSVNREFEGYCNYDMEFHWNTITEFRKAGR